MEESRRSKKELSICFLDLENAFGSIPHGLLRESLTRCGVPDTLVQVIMGMYSESTSSFVSTSGTTKPIPVKVGVRQGCPLSTTLFNLALEPVLRSALALSEECGFRAHGQSLCSLAYADDLVLMARSDSKMQRLLDSVGRAAEWCNLKFNAEKCAIFTIRYRGANRVVDQNVSATIQGRDIPVKGQQEFYNYLGRPVGMKDISPTGFDTDSLLLDIETLVSSLLAPWQKLEALKMFLLPRLSHLNRLGAISKKDLHRVDRAALSAARRILSLPKSSSVSWMRMPVSAGGAGLPCLADECEVARVVGGLKLLNSQDAMVRQLARAQLSGVVQERNGGEPDSTDLATFLTGRNGNLPATHFAQHYSFWTRIRQATARLRKSVALEWLVLENGDFAVSATQDNSTRRVMGDGRHCSAIVHRLLRDNSFVKHVSHQSQGKTAAPIAACKAASHFFHNGFLTRFCDWRFIHRARLNLLPVNSVAALHRGREEGGRSACCRRCGYQSETLPHVLNHCMGPHGDAYKKRHNAIVDSLVDATRHVGRATLDSTVPEYVDGANLRPDLVIRSEHDGQKIAHIVDVTVVFENGVGALEQARQDKIDKYEPIATALRAQGWTVETNDAVVLGSLGSWPQSNDAVLMSLGVSRRFLPLLRKRLVSGAIKWGRDIYTEHITGVKMYR